MSKSKKVLVPTSNHTLLTIANLDAIAECRQRLLGAIALLQLGLHHMDDDLVDDPTSIQLALLDVADRLREDVTMIGVTIDLAGSDGAAEGGA